MIPDIIIIFLFFLFLIDTFKGVNIGLDDQVKKYEIWVGIKQNKLKWRRLFYVFFILFVVFDVFEFAQIISGFFLCAAFISLAFYHRFSSSDKKRLKFAFWICFLFAFWILFIFFISVI